MTTPLPDGLHVIGKRDCPTCTMIEPVLAQVAEGGVTLTVYSQDDPIFPESISGVIDDTSLEQSYRLRIETVPTVIRVNEGKEVQRVVCWDRPEREAIHVVSQLGDDPPAPRARPSALSLAP